MEHVKGKDKGDLKLYTLSTCIWCKKTKALLKELGVDFSYVDVDLLEGDEKDRIDSEMDGYGSDISYPLVVHNGKKFCCGFEEEKLRKKFGK
jgi:glutaredoxin-like protein NrdH